MYADDHQTYVKGKDMCTVVAKLQESATLATTGCPKSSFLYFISLHFLSRYLTW